MSIKASFTFVLMTLFFFSQHVRAQEDESLTVSYTTVDDDPPMDPLAPSRAAFYSAVVPGLGQIFNKKYWKLPLVYGAIGTPVYFYVDNHKKYKEYRDEYKRRLRGIVNEDDPTFGRLDDDRVIQGQRFYQRNRDLSLVIAAGFYILNIVDANIDAHLMQFNVSDKLTIQPAFEFNQFDLNQYQYAINIQYRF